MVLFWWLGKVENSLKPKLIIALVLGGLQGLMGWYMVMSGLVDIPRVSHYRLAAHLVLALVIMAYLFWLVLDLRNTPRFGVRPFFRRLSVVLLGLVSLQIIYGAFTAGLRAGLGFNTFPLMDGRIMADAATMMTPMWQNFLENGAMVQFVHRWLGALLLLAGAALFGFSISIKLPRSIVVICGTLVSVVFIQFLIGVMTLINSVPILLASAHQAFACVVLLCAVYLVYTVQIPAETID